MKIRALCLGHIFLAGGLAGLGILSLISGKFAFVWEPVPDWLPWSNVLARLSGVFLFVCSLGMLLGRTSMGSTRLMMIYLLSWVLMREVPTVAHAPANVGVWLGVAESVMLVCGCWITLSLFVEREAAKNTGASGIRFFAEFGKRTTRILIGASCMVLGLSHFVFTDITAKMVPGSLPHHVCIAYLTGIGHFAAGLGILLAIVPRLAATLEASMISCFVLLVQFPEVFEAPSDTQAWMKLFAATAIAGSVWTVAYGLRGTHGSFARGHKVAVDPC